MVQVPRGKWLAAVVLFLWFFTHYGYDHLAANAADQTLTDVQNETRVAQAARDWFYVLRGFEGTFLFALVGILARRPLVWVVCLWGAFEEFQTAACGLAYPLRMDSYKAFKGICGNWYMVGVVVALWIALGILDREKKK